MDKLISSKMIYEGRIINLREDTVECGSGLLVEREVVEHPGGASIALRDDEGKFLMVSQYRYAQQSDLLEFPAGKIDENETPLEAVLRESQEETGYVAENVESLGIMVPTGAYLEEKIYMYRGTLGEYVGQNFDFDEELSVKRYSLEALEEMILNNEITDAKTIVMIYKMKLMDAQK